MDEAAEIRSQKLYDETIFEDPEIFDTQRVLLHAERARFVKRTIEGRRAVITRRTVTERKIIEVDVRHEELQIEYQPGDGHEILGEEPGTVVVRLHAEEIEIVKHVRVVEEIVLSKRRVSTTVPVVVALQREKLRVLDPTP